MPSALRARFILASVGLLASLAGCARLPGNTAPVPTAQTAHTEATSDSPPPMSTQQPTYAMLSALAQVVSLAEKKDFVGFAERFVPPGVLERDLAAGKTREQVGRERMGDPQQMAAKIRRVKAVLPSVAADGTRAVFALGTDRVALVRIEKRWYFV